MASLRTWLIYLLGCLLLLWIALPIAAHLDAGDRDIPMYVGHRAFGTFWASGDAANRGLDPYSVQPFTYRVHVTSPDTWAIDPNLNMPVLLPLFQAAARLPIGKAARVWTVASYLLFALGGTILLIGEPRMQARQALWLLLSMPVIATLTQGQLYALLYILAVATWVAFRRGNMTAAALLLGALIACKPPFLVWPILLAVCGQRTVALKSIAAAAAYSLLPMALYGPHVYSEWARACANDQHYLFLTNIALPAVGRRFGYPLAGWALAGLTGALCVAVAARRRSTHIEILSVVAACLCAPLGWSQYLLLAYPWMVERPWNWRRGSAALLLMIPEPIFWFTRIETAPHWMPAAGTALALAPALLLLFDASYSPFRSWRPLTDPIQAEA